jgi:hypothetical protein
MGRALAIIASLLLIAGQGLHTLALSDAEKVRHDACDPA